MTLDILGLPEELVVRILNTVSTRTLCRMRQTCHDFNNIAEENRFHIHSASSDQPRILWITIEKTPSFKAYVLHEDIDFQACNRFQRPLNGPKGILIQNGYKELSCIKFQAVVLEINTVIFGRRVDSIRQSQEILFKTFARSLMIQLKLSCDWLCFDNVHPDLAESVIEAVNFKSLGYCDRFVDMAQISKWNLKDCKEVNIGSVFNFGEKSIPSIRHLEVVKIRFSQANQHLFEDFMHNVRENPELRGNLKTLKLLSNEVKWKWKEVMDATPGVKTLLKTTIPFDNLSWLGAYRKMVIKGGVALVAHAENAGMLIHFAKEYSRLTLLNAFSPFTYRNTINLEQKQWDFMLAATDEEALSLLKFT